MSNRKTIRILAVADPAVEQYKRGTGITEIWEMKSGVHVEFEPVAWGEYPARVFDHLQSGKDYYDAVMVPGYFWLPKFATNGWISPLDELAKANPDIWTAYDYADIHPGLRFELSYENQSYLLPCFSEVQVIYYRKKLLAEAGIENIPASISTKDYTQFATAAHNLPHVFGTHFKGSLAESFPEWLPFFSEEGGELFDEHNFPLFNSDAGQKSLQALLALKKVSGPDIDTSDNETILRLLHQGKLAIINHWSGQIRPILNPDINPYSEDYGFTHFQNPWGSVWAFALNAAGKQQYETFSYLCWITNAQNDKEQLHYSGSPTRISTLTNINLAQTHSWLPTLNSALECRKSFPSFVRFADIVGNLYEMVNQVLQNTQSPKVALKIAESKCRETLS